MIRVAVFQRGLLECPDYQREIAGLLTLCGEARTWESVHALRIGGRGHRALEVGAWPLYFSRALKQRYEHVTATDSFEWVGRGTAGDGNPGAEEWMETMGAGIATQQADSRHLPWGDRHFEAVYAISVLEHIREDAAALREMLRVGRRVVITTDIALEPREYADYGRVYSPETLRQALAEATGGAVVHFDPMPPREAWMYPDLGINCCGFVVEQD